MLKADLYNFDGKKKEAFGLPKVYEVKPNLKLLTQAVHVYEDRSHKGLARAKTRSEVAISTRKIYRQKGTGGARHGARSAPIFVGGGAAHGPKGIKRILRFSKTQGNNAFFTALNYKVQSAEAVFVDGILKIKKTKEAGDLIDSIVKAKNWKNAKNIIVALSKANYDASLAFRNVSGITVDYFRNLNAYKVYLAKGVIIDKDALGEKEEIGKEKKEIVKEAKVIKKAISKNVKANSRETAKKITRESTKGRVVKQKTRRR